MFSKLCNQSTDVKMFEFPVKKMSDFPIDALLDYYFLNNKNSARLENAVLRI